MKVLCCVSTFLETIVLRNVVANWSPTKIIPEYDVRDGGGNPFS